MCNADGFSFRFVEAEEIFKAIFSIKSNAIGTDNIHPKFIKIITPVILPHITHIFNNIILRSCFPSSWKRAKIIPIPKKTNSNVPEYRPIAILPFLAKAFEKVISNQIVLHIDTNNLMTNFQSGFRKNRSCITALVKVSDDIRAAIDNDMIAILVLLDFSKAFDSVDHRLLLKKLMQQFNFSSSASRLIHSYLQQRSQCIYANTIFSDFLPNLSGVPQGSILGPLLFSLFINDLPSVVKNASCHMYADDVQIYLPQRIGLVEDTLARINEDLEFIHNWSVVNKLQLNASKSISIPFYRDKLAVTDLPDVKLGNKVLAYVSSVKNLGVIFDCKLSWSEQINSVVSKIYSVLRKLSISASFTPTIIRMKLVKSLIIPLIDYGCELFAGANISAMRKLEVAFNASIRYVFNLKKYDHVSKYRNSILGCNLYNHLNFRNILFLRKVLISGKPEYLYDKLKFDCHSRSLHIVPFSHRYMISEKQFFIRTIRLWNDLPIDIRRQYNDSKFKEVLFSYLCIQHKSNL